MTSTYNATPGQNTYPHTPHTHHTHTHFITSAPSWNWESLLEFIFLGQGNAVHILGLQHIDADEEAPRSTRLNIDSHFWMLEDWVLSKINVVGLEDWDFWLERIFGLNLLRSGIWCHGERRQSKFWTQQRFHSRQGDSVASWMGHQEGRNTDF